MITATTARVGWVEARSVDTHHGRPDGYRCAQPIRRGPSAERVTLKLCNGLAQVLEHAVVPHAYRQHRVAEHVAHRYFDVLAGGEGVELLQGAGHGIGHDLTHDVSGSDAMAGVALAVPDVVRELAQLRDAIHHDAHGAAPLEVDLHAFQRREGTFNARAQLGGNIPRITPGVVGTAAKQQAAVGGHAVVVEHEAAVVHRQVLWVELLGQLAQRLGGDDAAHGREDHALELLALKLVVHVAGQQYLFGFDAALSGNYRRVGAMHDVQHFGVFEDQRAQTLGGLGLADAQVQRVQMHVAGVLDRPAVQLALQVLAHALGVQQGDLITHAAAHGFLVGRVQLIHVHRLHRCMQVTVFEVALDAVFGHPTLDDVVAAPAQVPDEIIDVLAEGLAHLFVHGLFAGQAAGDLADVAPRGAPTDLIGLDDRHFQPTLGQFHSRGHAGKAATDDGHVNLHSALHRRVISFAVEGGTVIGRAALGGGNHGFQGSGHGVFLVGTAQIG